MVLYECSTHNTTHTFSKLLSALQILDVSVSIQHHLLMLATNLLILLLLLLLLLQNLVVLNDCGGS